MGCNKELQRQTFVTDLPIYTHAGPSHRLQTSMQGAFRKPLGTVARVHTSQVTMSICTQLQNKEHVIEALCQAKFKFPGGQETHSSEKLSFFKLNVDESEDTMAEKPLISDDCGVK